MKNVLITMIALVFVIVGCNMAIGQTFNVFQNTPQVPVVQPPQSLQRLQQDKLDQLQKAADLAGKALKAQQDARDLGFQLQQLKQKEIQRANFDLQTQQLEMNLNQQKLIRQHNQRMQQLHSIR